MSECPKAVTLFRCTPDCWNIDITKIGSAIWLFLWCISSTTKEVERDGIVWGIVLGNKPVKISDLENEFGVSDRTIRSWIKTLEDNQYIKVTRAPYGLVLRSETPKFKTDRKKVSTLTQEIGNILPIWMIEIGRNLPITRKKTSDLIKILQRYTMLLLLLLILKPF